MNPVLHRVYRLFFLIGAIGLFGAAQGQVAINEYACGPIKSGFGPFDYRTVTSDVRHRVEDWHFSPQVEMLKSGQSGYLGGDIDYTLRAMPNNWRALMSLVRYDLKTHAERIGGANYPIECYFERAIRFCPDDPMARVTYGIYLKNRKRPAEALAQLDEADRLRGDPSNFDLDYNLGIAYLDLGEYDKAGGRREACVRARGAVAGAQEQAEGKGEVDRVVSPTRVQLARPLMLSRSCARYLDGTA